jgi:two-component system, NarL family, sensor kinase
MKKSDMKEEVWILKEIAELLNEGTEVESVLKEVLKKLLHATGFQTGWIFLIQNGSVRLAAYESLPEALLANGCERMKRQHCWCVSRYNKGELNKASNIIECHRIESAIAEKGGDTGGLTHHATVPLMAGNERFGILNVGSPNKTYFEPGELALLEAIAFQIGTALKRIKLTQQEQEMALIAERNRLARDLHDSVNQLLFSISLTARAGMEMAQQQEEKEIFQYIQNLTQEALGEMRGLIWQLRPHGLENGIVSALTDYAKMLGLTLIPKISGVIRIPQKIEEALWRIGQEALANCKKHAKTDEVFLYLKIETYLIFMRIIDYGCGFSYHEKQALPSLGLKSMKYRTEELGGKFRLKTNVGEGTMIEIHIPMKRGDKEWSKY